MIQQAVAWQQANLRLSTVQMLLMNIANYFNHYWYSISLTIIALCITGAAFVPVKVSVPEETK
jgi:type II secretory pathway component PulF